MFNKYFTTILFCLACIYCAGCTFSEVEDSAQPKRLYSTSQQVTVMWENKINCMNLQPLLHQIPKLDERVYIPCFGPPIPSIIELNTTTGKSINQKNYHNIFELWSTDHTINVIHGETSLTKLNSQGEIISEYQVLSRNIRTGLPHDDRFYISTENDFRFDVFSFDDMQIVATDTSTVIVDSTETWTLINREDQVILVDSKTGEEYFIGRGTFIWGAIFNDNIWIWSRQNKLQLFDATEKRVTWETDVERGNFALDDSRLVTYQMDTMIMRDPTSLAQLASFDLKTMNNENLAESRPEIYAITLIGEQILIIYDNFYIASISYGLDGG